MRHDKKTSRRMLLRTWARSAAWLGCLPLLAFSARYSLGQSQRGPTLEERLLLGLRVKTKSDKAFIAKIVHLIEQGVLPIKLVDTTYFWARAKAARSRTLSNNPMVFFRPALVARAAKLGIRL